MTPAQLLTLTAGACLLLSTATSRASVEAGEGAGPALGLDNLVDQVETFYNNVTEIPADNEMTSQQQNLAAYLAMIRQAEVLANGYRGDPYAVCYGYRHTVRDFSNHPAINGEWSGERLPDVMCINAGFAPGCVSTAAGAYQIIKRTWRGLGLPDFSPASQDAAAIELIRRRGALQDVQAGRVATAIAKCKNEWASMPGNYAKQGQRTVGDLIAWYQQNGGMTA